MTRYNITSSYYSIDTSNHYSVWDEEDKEDVYREIIKSDLLGETVVKLKTISPGCISCRFHFLCGSLGLSSYVKKDIGDCSGYTFLDLRARGIGDINKSEDQKLKIELDEIRNQGYEKDEEDILIKLTITSWLKERGF